MGTGREVRPCIPVDDHQGPRLPAGGASTDVGHRVHPRVDELECVITVDSRDGECLGLTWEIEGITITYTVSWFGATTNLLLIVLHSLG